MKKILFLLIVTTLTVSVHAQRRYDRMLQLVEEHNPMLQAAQQRAEASRMQATVGFLLPDPEVELALYRGDPAEQGNRWDLRVMQSFEMPSVYLRRARLRTLAQQAATLDYATVRNTLLHETQLLCAEMVYAYGVEQTLAKQLTAAGRLMQLYEKRMQQGDCSVLEYNRVSMNLAEMQDKHTRALLQVTTLRDDLLSLTGSADVADFLTAYDTLLLPADFDVWYDSIEMANPHLLALQNAVQMSRQTLQLSRSQWLPEMSVGYASENTTGSAFRGVALGLKIPLWSQPRAVKQAHVAYSAAQQELEAERYATRMAMRKQMHSLQLLQDDLNAMRQAYSQYNSRSLLDKTLKAGEMTLEQYLLQTDYYTQQELAIWEIAHQLEQAYLNLYAFML